MILYFNARTIKSGSGGVQKWAREVLGAISELSKSQDFNFELVEISPKLPIFLNGPLAYIWEQLFLPLRIKNNGVLLSPGNVGPILVRDQCIVVHDLLPLMFPIHYSKKYVFAIKLIYRLLLKRVSHIVTVSDQQKSLIEELYNISSNKITNAGAGVQVTKLHQIDMNNEKNEVANSRKPLPTSTYQH